MRECVYVHACECVWPSTSISAGLVRVYVCMSMCTEVNVVVSVYLAVYVQRLCVYVYVCVCVCVQR